jgi:hypothetical protein
MLHRMTKHLILHIITCFEYFLWLEMQRNPCSSMKSELTSHFALVKIKVSTKHVQSFHHISQKQKAPRCYIHQNVFLCQNNLQN